MKTTPIALALLLAAGTVHATSDSLAVFSWDDYFGETTIADYQSHSKAQVLYDSFPSEEVLETKLLLGRSGYDVVFPSASTAERVYQAGALQAIDVSKLQHYGNIDAQYLEWLKRFEGGQLLGVPYTWGTIGIGYNTAAIAQRDAHAPVDSLDILFKPEWAAKFADCGIAIIDSPLEILSVALNYLGLDPQSKKREDLDRAEKLLAAIRPQIRYFDSTQPINDLASGEICLALTYSGDAGTAQLRADESHSGVSIGYAIPSQGTLVWMDLMAIPKDAPHADQAYAFIDYLLQPQVIAGVTNHLTYANANAKAATFTDAAIRENPAIYPDAKVRDRLFPDVALDAENTSLRTRVWTQVKTGI